jgi:hypothetical protein
MFIVLAAPWPTGPATKVPLRCERYDAAGMRGCHARGPSQLRNFSMVASVVEGVSVFGQFAATDAAGAETSYLFATERLDERCVGPAGAPAPGLSACTEPGCKLTCAGTAVLCSSDGADAEVAVATDLWTYITFDFAAAPTAGRPEL